MNAAWTSDAMIDTDERALAVLDRAAYLIDDPEAGLPIREAVEYLRRRLAQPDQSEPVATESVAKLALRSLVASCHLTQDKVDQALAIAAQFLAHDLDRTQAPGEWVLVPREPTYEMRQAGEWAKAPGLGLPVGSGSLAAYRAMLAAAPTPPSVPGKGGGE